MARKTTDNKSFDELFDSRYGELYQKRENDSELRIQGFISTGSLAIDACTGRGGLPKGKITFAYGKEGVGKSHFFLHFCRKCLLEEKLNVLYIDAEQAVDQDLVSTYFSDLKYVNGEDDTVLDFRLIVGENHLRVLKVRTFEQSLDLMQLACRTLEYKVVILDSISAISPKEELEKTIEEATMSKQAQKLNILFRTTVFDMFANQVTCILISQVRDSFGSYVTMEIPTGGHGTKHFASLIMHFQQPSQKELQEYVNSSEKLVMTDDADNPLYTYVRSTFVKNKIGRPKRSCLFPILFGKGIDEIRDVLLFASNCGVIEKSGAWFIYKDEKLGQGVKNALENLKQNPDIVKEIREKVLKIYHTNIKESAYDEEEFYVS